MISCVVSTPREMIYKITAIWLTYRYIHLLREVYADGIYLVIYSNQFIQVEKYIENIFKFLCVKDIFSKNIEIDIIAILLSNGNGYHLF